MNTAAVAFEDSLFSTIQACQELHRLWAGLGQGSQQDLVIARYQQKLEQLFTLVRPDLEGLSFRWLHSGLASDRSVLVMNLFSSIVIALPGIELDPTKNVRALLKLIAHRGAYDQYQQLRGRLPSGGKASIRSLDEMAELSQPLPSSESDTDWLNSLADREIVGVVLAYWQEHLSLVNRQIMFLRMQGLSFGEIAAQLGEIEVATVRQRYHRYLERTREYLRKRGLVEAE